MYMDDTIGQEINILGNTNVELKVKNKERQEYGKIDYKIEKIGKCR